VQNERLRHGPNAARYGAAAMSVLLKTRTGLTPGRIQKWIRLLFILVALAGLPLRATTFTVSMDRDAVLLGDTATLSLKFEDGQPQGTPQLPEIPGLQISYIGPANSFSFINGRTSSSVTHNYAVKPTQVGDFTIPALTIKFGSETLTSQAVNLKVTRPAAPTPGSEAEQQSLALLRIVLPKKEMFAGETIVLEQHLLVRSDAQNVSNLELPPLQLDGCTTAKAVQGPQRKTVVGNTTFALFPFYIPVTAIKSGTIKVGPIDGAVIVTMASRGRDPMEGLGFGFFRSGVQQRVALVAPEQTLTVLPLPENGKPASFSGAVGSYQMAFSASPTNVAVGDPITIRVQVKGHGSLDAFTLPDQPAWKEFKAYPPTVKTETTGDLGLDGIKSFEQIVVPQNSEIKELPEFDFAFFNPETRRYETLHQSAIPIIVHPGGATPAPTIAAGSSTPETPKPSTDIVHIKPRLGAVSRSSTPWVKQPWFIALQGLPVLALIGAIFWRQRTDSVANNPRLRRKKQTEQIIAEGLEQLPPLAAAGKADQFFATVFRLMQEQIGERLNLPASAITEAVVEEKLRPRGLGDGGADVLHELFQLCNQARYAPVESAQKLEAVIPKLKMALKNLQEVKA